MAPVLFPTFTHSISLDPINQGINFLSLGLIPSRLGLTSIANTVQSCTISSAAWTVFPLKRFMARAPLSFIISDNRRVSSRFSNHPTLPFCPIRPRRLSCRARFFPAFVMIQALYPKLILFLANTHFLALALFPSLALNLLLITNCVLSFHW